MGACDPRWRLLLLNGGRLEINVSTGMTNAAVFPEPENKNQRDGRDDHMVASRTRLGPAIQ